MTDTVFLKLGGSLITDKTQAETPRLDVLQRLASELAQVRAERPHLRLVLGHGSGSFGHVAAAKHGTRQGVQGAAQWRGFTEVAAAAARLNRLLVEALQEVGLSAISLSPSASAQCQDGHIVSLCVETVQQALDAGILPVVHGDVAFDSVRGGTIVSTEEVMSYLASPLSARWFLLAGEVAGVLDEQGDVIPVITPDNLPDIQSALGGSRGTDVTGGMASKVQGVLSLCQKHPRLQVRIFSGLEKGLLRGVLLGQENAGTVLKVG